MTKMMDRLVALEQANTAGIPAWYCIPRYENEAEEQAIGAYEGEHGPIGEGKAIMRVIIHKPGQRPA